MNELPDRVAKKAAGFPESSYGACKVTLILKTGDTVSGVTLAWGCEIVKINGKEVKSEKDLHFKIIDVVDVISVS